jgi:hypothetical protein
MYLVLLSVFLCIVHADVSWKQIGHDSQNSNYVSGTKIAPFAMLTPLGSDSHQLLQCHPTPDWIRFDMNTAYVGEVKEPIVSSTGGTLIHN